MTALKTAVRIIFLIIIMAVVGYVLFYVNGREQPGIPTPGQPVQVSVTVHTIKEQASTSPQVSVEYPQFPTLSAAFNTAIEKSVNDRLKEFRTEAKENYEARTSTAPADQYISPDDFSFIARWEPAQINEHYVSFIIRYDSYTGGANERQEIETYNYSVDRKSVMTLRDLFPTSADLYQQLRMISVRDLTAHLRDAGGPEAPLNLVEDGTAPIAENFENFTFTENILTIYFPKYAVAPGAFGEQKVVIPLKDIK